MMGTYEQKINLSDYIDNLFYELRMLLGASKMCELADTNEWGNSTNYVKDAVYVHSRNLYIFFTNKTRNDDDLAIKDFELKSIYSQLYPKHYGEWKEAYHDHILHLRKTRTNKPSNLHGTRHLNEQIRNFTNDIISLWETWESLTGNRSIKLLLEAKLLDAKKQSTDDYNKRYSANMGREEI